LKNRYTSFATKILKHHYKNVASTLLFLFFVNTLTIAQTKDSLLLNNTKLQSDTNTGIAKDSLPIANSDLKGVVKYSASDSIVYDAQIKQFLLYKNGQILYDDLDLKAGFITYNIDSSTMTAAPLDTVITDSTEKPIFKQAEQTFTFSELNYNFKSQRAMVIGAKTQYNDGFIISKQIKRNNDKSIFGLTNIYTTCDLDTPHFGIYAKKIKIIPDVVGISGPAQFVIEGIPTPLVLPFGIFPLKKGQHAGFILPQYGFNVAQGFGLTNIGYYQPINDYMDVKFGADIYSLGSYRASAATRYLKRYAYNGSLTLSFSKNVIQRSNDIFYDQSNTIMFGWQHSIDPRLLRGASFSANVNIGSSNSNQFNFNNNVQALLNNTMSSNINYSKSWPGKPYNLTISANHSQNNSTKRYDVTLPSINFSATGLTPFASKNLIGKPKWYDKISVNYTATTLNTIVFYDTAFSANSIKSENFNNGMEQRLSTAYNTTILKFFNWNISGNYNEYWYTKKRFRYYDANLEREDTILNNGFFTARRYTASTGITTNIYGLKTFKKGWIRGIRHHASPNISLNYSPDFGDPFYNYYYNTFLDKNYTERKLFYYDGAPIGNPGFGKNGNIAFGLNNNVQAKFANKKDTLSGVTKVSILDNFTWNTNYNFLADSNQWAPLSISYSTNILNKIRIAGGANYDFYSINKLGQRTKNYEFTDNKKLLRFIGTGMQISTQLASKTKSKTKNATAQQKAELASPFNTYNDFDIPFRIDLSINLGLTNVFNQRIKKDSLQFRGDFNFNGDVTLSENWKINFSSGYNVSTKQITASQIGLARNLHCWEMSFEIIPFGYGRGYVFILRPKSSLLKDLNVTRRRSFLDN
jgi:LptD protein